MLMKQESGTSSCPWWEEEGVPGYLELAGGSDRGVIQGGNAEWITAKKKSR